MKSIAILGSTGSIGTQTLDIIREQKGHFRASVLTANSNSDLLIRQAQEFKPDAVVIANKSLFLEVKAALAGQETQVMAGHDALTEVMHLPGIDMVITALVGFAGLKPTLAAIDQGIDIGLANKETLVVAGELVMEKAREKRVSIIPVDSEHSALFQCIQGEVGNPIEKIILTASGGPFRGYGKEQLSLVTRAQALKHPNWEMGAKITIDSASMMNKGLEVIEAKWLFDLREDQIEVVVHPQSIIHSVVQFEDASMKAQMGLPDMRVPIQYAMTYPGRLKNSLPRFDFAQYPSLTFEQVDTTVFKNLALAFQAMGQCGSAPCTLNAANEVTNALFRKEKIGFLEMADINEEALTSLPFDRSPSIESLIEADAQARTWVMERVKGMAQI
ncbi:MAG: 1-deoxy-D-xylulose-5-phosphate reductoisomerase [Bacteroidota bacterium]